MILHQKIISEAATSLEKEKYLSYQISSEVSSGGALTSTTCWFRKEILLQFYFRVIVSLISSEVEPERNIRDLQICRVLNVKFVFTDLFVQLHEALKRF